jgi:hypothetical protein
MNSFVRENAPISAASIRLFQKRLFSSETLGIDAFCLAICGDRGMSAFARQRRHFRPDARFCGGLTRNPALLFPIGAAGMMV